MTKPSVTMHPVHAALSHRPTERTPLFEIFQPFHPIHWKICGRNIATDMAMAWDVMAAGMTWPRLIEEGVADKVCIIGNIDARHTLCHGTESEVRAEVREYLEYRRRAKGGHILHASHSAHEDVKADNYFAVVNAYREYFDMEPLQI